MYKVIFFGVLVWLIGVSVSRPIKSVPINYPCTYSDIWDIAIDGPVMWSCNNIPKASNLWRETTVRSLHNDTLEVKLDCLGLSEDEIVKPTQTFHEEGTLTTSGGYCSVTVINDNWIEEAEIAIDLNVYVPKK